jgi:hypothetical protein
LAFWCGRILEGKRIAEGERNAEGKMNCWRESAGGRLLKGIELLKENC